MLYAGSCQPLSGDPFIPLLMIFCYCFLFCRAMSILRCDVVFFVLLSHVCSEVRRCMLETANLSVAILSDDFRFWETRQANPANLHMTSQSSTNFPVCFGLGRGWQHLQASRWRLRQACHHHVAFNSKTFNSKTRLFQIQRPSIQKICTMICIMIRTKICIMI